MVKDPLGAEVLAERLTDDFEPDRGREQDDDPVNLEPPDQPPDIPVSSVKNTRKVPIASFGQISANRRQTPHPPRTLGKSLAAMVGGNPPSADYGPGLGPRQHQRVTILPRESAAS